MHALTIVSLLASSATALVPPFNSKAAQSHLPTTSNRFLTSSQPPSLGVSLQLCGYDPTQPKLCGETPVQINQLLVASDGVKSALTGIRFGGNAWGVDIYAVQCRAYGNKEGTIPVGGFFDNIKDANFGETPVGVYSILCYIVTKDIHG